MVGNGFDGNFGNVLVAMALFAESRNVHVGSVLRFRGRFPLIAPNGVKDVLSCPFQAYAKTTDSGEEFDVSDFFLWGHILAIGGRDFRGMVGIIFP